jgi:hypothetical protein
LIFLKKINQTLPEKKSEVAMKKIAPPMPLAAVFQFPARSFSSFFFCPDGLSLL